MLRIINVALKKKNRVDNQKETHYSLLFEASNTILIGQKDLEYKNGLFR